MPKKSYLAVECPVCGTFIALLPNEKGVAVQTDKDNPAIFEVVCPVCRHEDEYQAYKLKPHLFDIPPNK